ncbi:MAG: hypothetical protein HQL07_04430 [Nitrospirae bacterium]|nr:hypothetical protein [Magnetococcales bacterium]HAT50734.1 hypothetical protein [Alphaproteobacteria bacterium]
MRTKVNPETGRLDLVGDTLDLGPALQGVWSGSVTYAKGEVVSYGGPLYVSLADANTDHQPDANPTWWGEVTQRGATGQPGVNPGVTTMVAGEALASLRVVSVNATGHAVYADAQVDALATSVIGVTLVSVGIGESVSIQTFGVVTDPGWTFTPGSPIFLGINSLLSASPPLTGWMVKMGIALSSTDVAIQRQLIVKLA